MPITKASGNSVTAAAKGDLVVGNATNDSGVLTVGANNTVLTADSSTATGLKWAAPSSGANWSLLNSGGTALTGAQTITISGISGKDKIMVLLEGASSANAGSYISVRLNTDTASNYYEYGANIQAPVTYDASQFTALTGGNSRISVGRQSSGATGNVFGYVELSGCNSSGVKVFTAAGFGRPVGGTNSQEGYMIGGYYDSASTISSVSAFSTSGNFDAGTIYVYTSA